MSDIADFFAKDPLHLLDTDLDAIVAYYRDKRESFLVGPAKAAKRVKDPKAKVDLDTLDIEI
jgi:hypothetical protein